MVHKTEIVDGHYFGCVLLFEENAKTGNENENDSTHLDSGLAAIVSSPRCYKIL